MYKLIARYTLHILTQFFVFVVCHRTLRKRRRKKTKPPFLQSKATYTVFKWTRRRDPSAVITETLIGEAFFLKEIKENN